MAHPLVSVIVPVSNAAQYLPQCLDSIFAQTFTDFEIICIDDGSQDSSPQILAQYHEKYPQLQILYTANLGVSIARNTGLKKARGKYIAFLDADDFIDPQLFEKTITQAEQTNAEILIYDYFLYHEPQGTLSTYRDQKLYHQLDRTVFNLTSHPEMIQFMGIWDRIFRRDFLEKHQLQFVPEHIYEDAIFCVAAMLKAERVCLLAEHLYYYRRGVVGSITFDEGQNDFKKKEFLFAQEMIQKLLRAAAVSSEIKYFYLRYFIEYALMHQRYTRSKADFQKYFQTIRSMIFPEFRAHLPRDLALKRKVYLGLLALNQRKICRLFINLANLPRTLRTKFTNFTNPRIFASRR